ncbi:hypothetical protein DVH24_001310 [Malus domestica]|uniref:Aspergillus nuclease S1 n=1 Tax=Malus domestica TaxID=3750 RepID=A0A498K0U9_MALDO|nr:hypothetical protein DVH24_001310 [Malus domestica]
MQSCISCGIVIGPSSYDVVSSTILSCDQCREEHVCCCGRYSSANACRVLSDEGGNSIALRWYRHKSNLHHVWDREIIQQTMKDYYDRTHRKDFGKQFADGEQKRCTNACHISSWFYFDHVLLIKGSCTRGKK